MNSNENLTRLEPALMAQTRTTWVRGFVPASEVLFCLAHAPPRRGCTSKNDASLAQRQPGDQAAARPTLDRVGRRLHSPYPPAMTTAGPMRVNRAALLTLWATIVAERLGYPSDTALTLGRFVAGSSARAKARSLRITDEPQDATDRRERAAAVIPQRQVVHLLGRDVPVVPADDGTMRANDKGQPASARGVRSCIMRAFGDRLGEVREAMEALAASLPPEELNSVGFRPYERFRPDAPAGAEGWGAKGQLRLERIRSARA